MHALQIENSSVEFRGEEHFNEEDIEIITDNDIIETELTEEEIEANISKKREESQRKISEEKITP